MLARDTQREKENSTGTVEIVVYDHPSNPDPAKRVMNGKDVAQTESSFKPSSAIKIHPILSVHPLKMKCPAQSRLTVPFDRAADIRYTNMCCLSTKRNWKYFPCLRSDGQIFFVPIFATRFVKIESNVRCKNG